MTLQLRGMGAAPVFGEPRANMSCFLTPECRDGANLLCYDPTAIQFWMDKCASWRNFYPTPAEIAANDTNAGAQLSAASKVEATRQAQQVIAAEIASHPERYGELCPAGAVPQIDGTCRPCADGYVASDGMCVKGFNLFGVGIPTSFLVVGGLIGATVLLLALKR